MPAVRKCSVTPLPAAFAGARPRQRAMGSEHYAGSSPQRGRSHLRGWHSRRFDELLYNRRLFDRGPLKLGCDFAGLRSHAVPVSPGRGDQGNGMQTLTSATQVLSFEKSWQKKSSSGCPTSTWSTIGHVDHGKTTLTAAIATVLSKFGGEARRLTRRSTTPRRKRPWWYHDQHRRTSVRNCQPPLCALTLTAPATPTTSRT